jgi:hypothetical protein
MASDGGCAFIAPGVTTVGTGDQISVSSGFGADVLRWARSGVPSRQVAEQSTAMRGRRRDMVDLGEGRCV